MPQISFLELIKPFYGKQLNAQIEQARNYVNQTFPADQGGNRETMFGPHFFGGLSPGALEQKFNVVADVPFGEKDAFRRERFDSTGNTIHTKDKEAYTSGKPIAMMVGDRIIKTPTRDGYNDLLQHEASHGQFPVTTRGWSDKPGPGYYDNPGELGAQLAVMQRERFKSSQARFDEKSLPAYLTDFNGTDAAHSNSTLNLFLNLQGLMKSQQPEDAKKFQEILKTIPGLVHNENPVAKQIFG